MKSNLRLWEAVSVTDPAHTKSFNSGSYSGTAIDPTSQAMKATEIFGPFGVGWGIEGEEYRIDALDEDTKLMIYTGELWYSFDQSKGQFPITSSVKIMYKAKSGRMIYDDDATKKVQTNAISKGLSRLGFSADVFLGKFDDDKYVKAARDFAADERPMDRVQLNAIGKLIEQADPDIEAMLQHFGVDQIEEIPASRYQSLAAMLVSKIKKLESEAVE